MKCPYCHKKGVRIGHFMQAHKALMQRKMRAGRRRHHSKAPAQHRQKPLHFDDPRTGKRYTVKRPGGFLVPHAFCRRCGAVCPAADHEACQRCGASCR